MSYLNSVIDLVIEGAVEFQYMDRKELEQSRKDLIRAINALGYKVDKDYIELEFKLLTFSFITRNELRLTILRKYKELR
jgi:hypothetical protein